MVPPFRGPTSATVRPLLRVSLAAPNRLTAPPFPAIVAEPVSSSEPDVGDFAFDASSGLVSVEETTDINTAPPVVPATPDWQGTPDWAMPVVEAPVAEAPVEDAPVVLGAAFTPPARERVTPVLVSAVTTTPMVQPAIAEGAVEDAPEEPVRSTEVRSPTPVTFHTVPDLGDSTRAVAEALESLAARVRRGELAIAGAVPAGDAAAAVAAALAALLGVRAAS